MELKNDEDLGRYIIRLFGLEEDEYEYEHKKIGYEFSIQPKNNLKKLRMNNLEKTVKDYCKEKNMYLVKKEPITYIDLKKTETIQVKETEDKAIYKIRVTQMNNREN